METTCCLHDGPGGIILAGDIKMRWRLNEESCVKIAEAENIGVERLYSLKIHAIPNVKVKIYIFLL